MSQHVARAQQPCQGSFSAKGCNHSRARSRQLVWPCGSPLQAPVSASLIVPCKLPASRSGAHGPEGRQQYHAVPGRRSPEFLGCRSGSYGKCSKRALQRLGKSSLGHSQAGVGSASSLFVVGSSPELRSCGRKEQLASGRPLGRRKHRTAVRCQGNADPWWRELLSDLGVGKRKGPNKRWGEGSDRREGRRRGEAQERPEVPRRGVSTLDELAGRSRPPDPPRKQETWKPLGGASRFQYPLEEDRLTEESWWEIFRGGARSKEKDANVWGGGRNRPWWERRKKWGWGLGDVLGGLGGSQKTEQPPRRPPWEDNGRPEPPLGGGDGYPLDTEPLTEGEKELDETLDRLLNYPKPPGEWVEWLDDSYSNKYSDYVGGSGSGWYEEENEWLKGGNPRLPPDIPERGMSRTIKEMVLRIFEPRYEVEDDLAFEERVFRFTTQETAKFVVALIFSVAVSDWVVHDFVLVPFMKRYTEKVPLVGKAFDLREKQKLDIVQRLKLERQRVRFEAEIGKAPPLSEKEMREHMREEALHLREEIREENRSSFSNIISDLVAFLVGTLVYVFNPKRVALMRLTGQRIFTNISDTGKAFIIILLTDIFLGYHSENGWETVVELFLDHYGLEVEQHSIYIFVSTVPVTIDAVFKLWVFRYLSKLSPSAAATFKTMNRH